MCPACGQTLAALPEAAGPKFRRSLIKRLIVIALGLIILIGVLIASAYAGLYYGERDREEQLQATIQQHYNNGLIALNNGQYDLAEAHFQYVLQLDPENALAKQGVAEARARQQTRPTPTSEAAQALNEQLLQQATAAFDMQDWATAAGTLTQLRAFDAEYHQAEVEAMLFTSLYNAGMALLDEDKLEEGIFYLDQAVALRPLDAEAVNQRNLAARYQAALSFWGVDWEKALSALEELYTTHPDYKDIFAKYYQAHIEYGDQLVTLGEMCPAEIIYTKSLRLIASAGVEQKRAQAAEICLIATPVPLVGDQPMLTPQAIPGFNVGRLGYTVYNTESGLYDLYALYANGQIIRVARSADQPWWQWGTGRMVYRDRYNGAISMVLPEEGVPQMLTTPDGRAWPTLAPDGQRMAYAQIDAATGAWMIYIAPTYGGGEARALTPGWAPAWGPTGMLAYTGCDADGVSCGITLDNPDDGQPGRRLTGSSSDTAASWAPGGNLLAYMANVTGNWDILLLGIDGGISQLTYEASDEGMPAWAPNGSGVAFVSNRDGKWAIYIATPDGQNVQRILDLGIDMPAFENQRLSWAP